MKAKLSPKLIYSCLFALALGFGSLFVVSTTGQEPDQIKEQIFREAKDALQKARDEGVPLLAPKNFAKVNEFYQKALEDYEKGEGLKKIRENLKRAMEHIDTAFESAKLSRIVLERMLRLREETLNLEFLNYHSGVTRPGYFKDKFLTENDFLDEQSYHIPKAEQKFREAAMKIEDGDVKSAKSIAREAEEEYRWSVIEALRKIVLADARKKLKDTEDTIPKESFRRAKAELDEMEDFIKAQKEAEFAIGELVTEVNGHIQQVLDTTVIEVEAAELPDLVIEEVTFISERPIEEEEVVINAVVRNVGTAPTEGILVVFSTCGEREIGRATIEYLKPEQVEEAKITTTAYEVGECLVTVLVDPENRIEESDEQNNEAQRLFVVETPFFEEYPAWNMPDPAVTSLTVEPNRANPGESIILRATVANEGTGATSAAELIFLVDNLEIDRQPVDTLGAGGEVEVGISWTAENSGRHEVTAQLELEADDFDRSLDNNFQTATVRVSGTEFLEPEIEVELLGFNSVQLTSGESYTATLNVLNPSFDEVRNIPVKFYIDGELVSSGAIEYLESGEEQGLQFPWSKFTPGEHMLELQMDLPDQFPYADLQSLKSWHVIVPDKTELYDTILKDKWVPLGPCNLTNGVGGITTGSVGRIDAIAFHPDPNNAKIMYAGSPAGGLWKTEDSGNSWTPLTDKLPSLNIGAVAVDPKHPDIVYLGTGSSRYKGGIGIFKSIDGGKTWTRFANHAIQIISWNTTKIHPIMGVSRLVINYPNPGKNQVMIYAATNCGLLRYKSTNPKSIKNTTPDEWVQILPGVILDMAVSPKDASVVYASVNYYSTINKEKKLIYKGLYRTHSGETVLATKYYTYWKWLKKGLPNYLGKEGYWATLDIFENDPKILYTAIRYPGGVEIYSSNNEGDSWTYQLNKKDNVGRHYNPFIRVHPSDPSLVYFGGVKLYKGYILPFGGAASIKIEDIHDDMHGMEWDPQDPSKYYYILTDGGIWHCKVNAKQVNDSVNPRNKDLQVTMFYDFDLSQTNSKLMIGGTQDCGTILYKGTKDWRIVRGNDGLFSLIAPGDKFLYSQEQHLISTGRSEAGVNTTYFPNGGSWKKANSGLPTDGKWVIDNAYITVHPKNPKNLLSQGDEVYATWDAGDHWVKKGLKGSQVKGFIKRVVFQPKTDYWFAGTSKGQIWYSTNEGGYWKLLDSHPDGNAYVTGMAFASTNHNVLYVTYGECDPYRRIQRFEMQSNGLWMGTWITDNLPIKHVPAGATVSYTTGKVPIKDKQFITNVKIFCIAGDGHSDLIAYVGTDKGVFRGEAACGTCLWNWKPYNDGSPLVEVRDLLVDPSSKQLRAATYGRGAWGVITGP